jgi:DNA polymerase-3 subunit gamma/tau
LQEAWEAFRQEKEESNIGEMERLILRRDVKLVDENILEIELNSNLELSILDRFEQELIVFFRNHLENDVFELRRQVREEKQEKKLYTSTDKFNYMAEKNPALKLLKEKLGLDFEF